MNLSSFRRSPDTSNCCPQGKADRIGGKDGRMAIRWWAAHVDPRRVASFTASRSITQRGLPRHVPGAPPRRTWLPSRCAVRTPARHLASKLAVRRTGNALPRAHDRYDMRGACTATRGARDPIRFPVSIDVVACRRCAHRSGEIRLRQRHRVNRKARAMRRKPKRKKRDRQAQAVTRVAIVGKCFRNASVFGGTRGNTRSTASHIEMRNACRNEAGRPSAHADTVAVNRERRNALKKRCKSVTSRPAHAMPLRNRARRGRVNTDACACILSVSRTEAIREPIGKLSTD